MRIIMCFFSDFEKKDSIYSATETISLPLVKKET